MESNNLNSNTLKSFLKIFKYISQQRRRELYFLLLIIILSGLFEIITIGAVVPFLTVLVNPQKILDIAIVQKIIITFNLKINNPNDLITPLSLFFGISALSGGLIRTLNLWKTVHFSSNLMSELSIAIYKNVLSMPFSYHLKRNTSEVISALTNDVDGVQTLVQSILNLLTASIVGISIFIGLFLVNFKTTSLIFLTFGGLYSIIVSYTKGKVGNISKIIRVKNVSRIKILQESLSAIRDVLIQGSQNFYSKNFGNYLIKLNKVRAMNTFFVLAPRYIMEAIGIFTISIIALFKSDQSTNLSAIVPTLGAISLGAQRLLPILQLSYTGWNSFRFNSHLLKSVIYYLELKDDSLRYIKSEEIEFKKEIKIKNLNFNYVPNKIILEDINFTIRKGSKIGIIGQTGSGKTTLINLLMCLQEPVSGGIFIDGKLLNKSHFKSWCRKVAHVPQDLFMLDASISENIAFGVDPKDIDQKLVEEVAERAKISEFINSLKYKYKTIVGERGVRMSGGQRQRIGIARALYKKAEILILDEITSALDTKTALQVMNEIIQFDDEFTIIVISHKPDILKGFNAIYKVEKSKLALYKSS